MVYVGDILKEIVMKMSDWFFGLRRREKDFKVMLSYVDCPEGKEKDTEDSETRGVPDDSRFINPGD